MSDEETGRYQYKGLPWQFSANSTPSTTGMGKTLHFGNPSYNVTCHARESTPLREREGFSVQISKEQVYRMNTSPTP